MKTLKIRKVSDIYNELSKKPGFNLYESRFCAYVYNFKRENLVLKNLSVAGGGEGSLDVANEQLKRILKQGV